jgi:hypothetical protein
VKRRSCARGEEADTIEFARNIEADGVLVRRAA